MSREARVLFGVAALCLILLAVRLLAYDVLISLVIGGVITGVCSRYYYQRASNDLKIEAKELRRLNELIMRGLEEEEPREFVQDPITGKRVGVKRKGRMTSEAKTSIDLRAEVRHKDDTPTQ